MEQRTPLPADTDPAAVIAARLADRVDDVTQMIQQHLISEIAEMRGQPQLLDLLRDSVAENVETVFSAIQHGTAIERIEPPPSALAHARELARRGAPANALVRAYRLGQQTLLDIVLDEVRLLDLDTQQALDVFQSVTATTFTYIDQISQRVTAAYQVERERCLAAQNTARAIRVRELLESGPVDIDEVSVQIGYPLRRIHLAVVVSYTDSPEGDELVHMGRLARSLAECLGSQGAPLLVAADRLTGWGWIPLTVDSAAEAVERTRQFAAEQRHPPLVAIGDPLPGVEGFRRSHRQALGALRVLTSGAQSDRFIANTDPGVSAAALHVDNLPAARAWVGEVLGGLASATEADERLRETLWVFLQSGSSYKAAATDLNMHFNTVRYRVQRAEERRGRPITTTDRLDVEIALLLCHWFQAAVLQ